MGESKVLAIVNGREITELALVKLIQKLGPKNAMYFKSPEGKKRLIQELINQELMYSYAIDNRYDEEEDFLRKLDEVEEDLLKEYTVLKLANNIGLSEEELQAYYKERKMSYLREESVRASHILVDTQEKAEEILAQLRNGVSFEECAKDNSTCPSKERGGDLGFFTKGKMVKEFDEAVFKMEKDEISEPVKTQFGYHIIKLTDKKEAGLMTFDEVKPQLVQELLKAKQAFYFEEKMKELSKMYKIEIKEDENTEMNSAQ